MTHPIVSSRGLARLRLALARDDAARAAQRDLVAHLCDAEAYAVAWGLAQSSRLVDDALEGATDADIDAVFAALPA